MAEPKWSQWEAAGALTGGEVIPLLQDGENLRSTLTDFAAFIGTSGGSDRLSSRIYHLSKYGVPNDADISKGSSTFGTDGTATIQAILNSASATNSIVVFVDTRTSITQLKIKSNTALIGMPGCGFIQRNGSNVTMIRMFTENMTTITYQNVVFDNLYLNGNKSGQTDDGDATKGYTNLVNVIGVRNFRMTNCTLTDPKYFTFLAARTDRLYINNCVIDGFIDGIDVVGANTNYYVGNCWINGHDDHIACGSEPLVGWAPPGDYYTGCGGSADGIYENIVFGAGGQWGIRFWSTIHRLDLTFRNITGETSGYVVHGRNNYGGGVDDPGDGANGRIIFEDCDIRCNSAGVNDTAGDWTLCGNTDSIEIRGCKFYRDATTMQRSIIAVGPLPSDGNQTDADRTIKKLTIEGCSVTYESGDASEIVFLDINSNTIPKLNIRGTSLIREGAASPNNSMLVRVGSGATVPHIMFDNCEVDGGNSIIQSAGLVDTIQAVGIQHRNSDDSVGSFVNTGPSAIQDLCVSNYYGVKTHDGSFARTRGDAFDVGGLPDNPNAIIPITQSDADFSYTANVLSNSSGVWASGSAGTSGYGNIGVGTKHSPAGTGVRMAAVWNASAPATPAKGGALMLSTSSTPQVYTAITGVGLLCDMAGNLYAVENGVTTLLQAANGEFYWIERDPSGLCRVFKTLTQPWAPGAAIHTFASTLTGALYPIINCNKPNGFVYYPQWMRF